MLQNHVISVCNQCVANPYADLKRTFELSLYNWNKFGIKLCIDLLVGIIFCTCSREAFEVENKFGNFLRC